MMKFLRYNQIDKERWNRCIAGSSYPTIFVEYDFLSLASPKWNALVKGDYDYVMPLPVRSKLSIRYILTPFFNPRLGIFSALPVTEEIVRKFIDHIPKFYKQIDLNLNETIPYQVIAKESIMLRSYRLSLNKPYLLLYPLFSTNTKRNIKSAEKYQLSFTYDIALSEVTRLFKQNKGKEKAIPFKRRDYRQLEKLAGYARDIGRLDVVGVQDDKGKLIAGAYFLKDNKRVWFWFSGRDNRFAEKKAMFFLINEYMKANENKDIVLDFNGSMNENIARLYRGFGGEEYQYPVLCYSRRFYLNKLIQFYKEVKSH